MDGSLSVASTAVSLVKVVVADSGEVGRSAAYNKYNNGPMMLQGVLTFTGENSLYLVSTCMRKRLLCK
jgi:hypothetical protein